MKHGELGDRVERLATRIVNEYPSFHNWCYYTLVDEVVHEMLGGRVGEVCGLASSVVVLCELFGFESLVVVARLVERSRTNHAYLEMTMRLEETAKSDEYKVWMTDDELEEMCRLTMSPRDLQDAFEELYPEGLNHGRLYPSLDRMVDSGSTSKRREATTGERNTRLPAVASR